MLHASCVPCPCFMLMLHVSYHASCFMVIVLMLHVSCHSSMLMFPLCFMSCFHVSMCFMLHVSASCSCFMFPCMPMFHVLCFMFISPCFMSLCSHVYAMFHVICSFHVSYVIKLMLCFIVSMSMLHVP
jgi:hypothetical protein